MKRLSLMVVFAGLVLGMTATSGVAGDCCRPKKCLTMPRLLPRLKSLCCRPKCDPCATGCAATPNCAASASTPSNDPPKPTELTPSAADQPKK